MAAKLQEESNRGINIGPLTSSAFRGATTRRELHEMKRPIAQEREDQKRRSADIKKTLIASPKPLSSEKEKRRFAEEQSALQEEVEMQSLADERAKTQREIHQHFFAGDNETKQTTPVTSSPKKRRYFPRNKGPTTPITSFTPKQDVSSHHNEGVVLKTMTFMVVAIAFFYYLVLNNLK